MNKETKKAAIEGYKESLKQYALELLNKGVDSIPPQFTFLGETKEGGVAIVPIVIPDDFDEKAKDLVFYRVMPAVFGMMKKESITPLLFTGIYEAWLSQMVYPEGLDPAAAAAWAKKQDRSELQRREVVMMNFEQPGKQEGHVYEITRPDGMKINEAGELQTNIELVYLWPLDEARGMEGRMVNVFKHYKP